MRYFWWLNQDWWFVFWLGSLNSPGHFGASAVSSLKIHPQSPEGGQANPEMQRTPHRCDVKSLSQLVMGLPQQTVPWGQCLPALSACAASSCPTTHGCSSCHQHRSSLQGQGWGELSSDHYDFSLSFAACIPNCQAREMKITAKSFCYIEVVQLGTSIRDLLHAAHPREVYCNGIYQQWRDGVSLAQFSANTCSLPVENMYPYLYLK